VSFAGIVGARFGGEGAVWAGVADGEDVAVVLAVDAGASADVAGVGAAAEACD
jgi:hypothetical protein